MTGVWAACGGGGGDGPADSAIVDAARDDARVADGALVDASGTGDAPAVDSSMTTDGPWPDALVADAAPPCGCVEGEYCDLEGNCQSAPGPTGAYCGPTAACGPDDPGYPDCFDQQCVSMVCGALSHSPLLFMRNVCTRACLIYQDNDFNNVNDLDAPSSDCRPSAVWQGPAGTAYRCVNHAPPATTPAAYCLPGSEFVACNVSSDCPDGEVCDLGTIGGEVSLHCYARYQENSSWPAQVVGLGETCNNDLASGPLVYCADGLCLDTNFCSAFCTGAADCDTTTFTPGQHCIDTKCENVPTRDCAIDTDCSTAECGGVLDLGGGPIAAYCTPRA